MSLFAVGESIEPIDYIPHSEQFDRWKVILGPTCTVAIQDALAQHIDQKLDGGKEVVTVAWLLNEMCPNGSEDWSGTPFQEIWTATAQSYTQTAMCFGLFVWEHMKDRPEHWHCMRCEVDGRPIDSMTYFLCRVPHGR